MSNGVREADRGLGTTYERFALCDWLDSVANRYSVHSVFEGPGDGIAGIPGIHGVPLARKGCDVTVALDDPKEIAVAQNAWTALGCTGQIRFILGDGLPIPCASRRFDLVWNFNRLPFLEPRLLVAEMARVSRCLVALVVPNRWSYGFIARRVYHRRISAPWPYGNTTVMSPACVRDLMEQAGMRVLESRWMDVAWWPDIIDPGAWLRAMFPPACRLLLRVQRDSYHWTATGLPYFDPIAYADLHRQMHRLGWLERARPGLLKAPFAHHFAILAEKPDAAA